MSINEFKQLKRIMVMARPIRETPILSGKDARMFEKKMREVKSLSEARRQEMRKQYESFLNKVTIKV